MTALTELTTRQKILNKTVNFLNSWQAKSKKKMLVTHFFILLTQGKKTAAKKTLEEVKVEPETSPWRKGYINALEGMITALELTNDQDTFINQIKTDRIDEFRRLFLKQSFNELNTDFDKGYFSAWAEYIQSLKPTVMTEQTALNLTTL